MSGSVSLLGCLLKSINDSLLLLQDTPSKKRVVEPAVYVCVSLVARGVEGAVRNDVKELLEPMMATGLSPPLTLALQELATEIPSLKVGVQRVCRVSFVAVAVRNCFDSLIDGLLFL